MNAQTYPQAVATPYPSAVTTLRIAQVVLDLPVGSTFDFRVPDGIAAPRGSLVVVPFGRSEKVGVVVATAQRTDVAPDRLRDIRARVEDVGPLSPGDLALLTFCARYYQRPLGEAILASLPPRLRQVRRRRLAAAVAPAPPGPASGTGDPELNAGQLAALESIQAGFGRFHPVLLRGVTGSGKTEVYLRCIAETLARGRQALLLVPEIGLTPQLEARVRERFPSTPLAILHSHLPEGARASAWLAAQAGEARIVVGTRLAALTPLPELGLILVDEEHDASYKQQDGLRYSARDVAVRRAQLASVPIVLGSATPSLESWANARSGRYQLLELPMRALAGARMPVVRTVDTRADPPRDGLSAALLAALRARAQRGEQSLVFVNRRGYSPVLFCRACAWHPGCARCSANLVLHRSAGSLRCHHCGHIERTPARCVACGSPDLVPVGHGTQRLESALREALPGARIARVDRDATGRAGSLATILDDLRAHRIDILVGTQMLAKGHDFPGLTLVGVVDADAGLFSADFRAAERLFALLTQVAGRAGRAGLAGEVLIQTDVPGHPLYAAVAAHDYAAFADGLLAERRAVGWPPFSHLALLRAEAREEAVALAFLRRAARGARESGEGVEVFDPVPAPLARRAGLARLQLLVRSRSRNSLQAFLADWRRQLEDAAERRVRWAIDVDPAEA